MTAPAYFLSADFEPGLAKAVVDRLTHRAHIIETGNESWRFKHGLTRSKRRRTTSS